MPVRSLPNNPSLEHLRKDAKRLRRAVAAHDAGAIAQVREFHPHADDAVARMALTDAQLVVARSYGFASWPRLKQHLAEIAPFVWTPPGVPVRESPADAFVRLACLTYSAWHRSNPERARRLLEDHPEAATASIYHAAA